MIATLLVCDYCNAAPGVKCQRIVKGKKQDSDIPHMPRRNRYKASQLLRDCLECLAAWWEPCRTTSGAIAYPHTKRVMP